MVAPYARIDPELRFNGPIPDAIRNPSPSLEAQERTTLRSIRECRRDHTDILRQWRQQILSHDFARADASLSYAKDIRDLAHAHIRNIRLIRLRMQHEADRAAARLAAE